MKKTEKKTLILVTCLVVLIMAGIFGAIAYESHKQEKAFLEMAAEPFKKTTGKKPE